MKESNCEKLVKMIFADRVPQSVYSAMSDLDKADNHLIEAIRTHSVQPHHHNILDAAKSRLFDLLTDDGMIVIGKIPSRYEEIKK